MSADRIVQGAAEIVEMPPIAQVEFICQARTPTGGVCGATTPHATNHNMCSAGHFIVGNSQRRIHGVRAFETTGRLPDVLRQTVDEFREAVIAEPDQFAAVCAHLPPDIQPIVKFAYITGWRIQSEVLPLEWRRVDFSTGDVRLDAGTTKNKKPRVIKMTDDLRALLAGQHVEHERVKKAGHICPFVFFREVADERGGEKKPRQVKAFTKSWKIACQAAGCPGRIPHDLRRTAVRNMVRRGIPEGVAMKWTGHTTRSIFERYNIVSEGDMTAAAERLSGLLGPSIASATARERA